MTIHSPYRLPKFIAAVLGALFCLFADPPEVRSDPNPPGKMTYQGFLTDGDGRPLGIGNPTNVAVIFRIWDTSQGGTQQAGNLKWASQQTVTVDNGHFSVLLGEGSQVGSEPRPDLATVFTGQTASDRYMEITVNGVAITPRLRFLPSPYAMLAKSANQIVGTDGSAIVDGQSVTVSGTVTAGSLASGAATVGSLTVTGTNTAQAFAGDGSSLTDLNANSITTGTIGVDRIPGLDAGKVVTGTLAEARIPGLDAGKVATGTLAEARLPGTVARKSVVNRFTQLNHFEFGGDNANGQTITGGGSIQLGTATDGAAANRASGLILFHAGAPGQRHGLFGYYPSDGNVFRIGGYGSSHHDSAVGLRVSGRVTAESELVADGTTVLYGSVGIGDGTPTEAKLVVRGTGLGTAAHTGGYIHDRDNPLLRAVGANAAATWSIYADGTVGGLQFMAHSDERIKEIQGRSDGKLDLIRLQQIEVTDYRLRDTVRHGNSVHKKVIAQQVEEVYPQAVSKSSGVIPDIFIAASQEDGWISLQSDLKAGERVRLIGEKSEGVYEVLEVANDRFRTKFRSDSKRVFVYGREVNDFRNVDYEAISMLNVSATQELARRLEAVEARETRLHELEQKASRVSALETEVRQLKAKVTAMDTLGRELALLKKLVTEVKEQRADENLSRLATISNRTATSVR